MTPAGKLEKSFSSGRAWPSRHIIYITIFVLSSLILGSGRRWLPMLSIFKSDDEALFCTKYVDRCSVLCVCTRESVCVCACARVCACMRGIGNSVIIPSGYTCSCVVRSLHSGAF